MYTCVHLYFLQEEEQKHLEEEMQKRRERIEKWRQERKKQQDLVPINISQPAKQWTLEDDEDEDEEEVNNGGDADEELDPLDAYMQVKNLAGLVMVCVGFCDLRTLRCFVLI